MNNTPERIWLQKLDGPHPKDGWTWASHPIGEPDLEEVEYVRADTVANAPTVARDEQQAGDVVARLEVSREYFDCLVHKIRALEKERDKHHRLQVEAEDRATGLCRQLATAREALEPFAKTKVRRETAESIMARIIEVTGDGVWADWVYDLLTKHCPAAARALKTLSTTEQDNGESAESYG